MCVNNESSKQAMRAVDASRKEKKSQTNSLAFRHRTEWEEKKEKKCNCLAHIKYIVLLVYVRMCAGVRTREKERKESEPYQGAIRQRTRKKRRQYKLQAKWSSSSIDRPSARRRKRERKKTMYICV